MAWISKFFRRRKFKASKRNANAYLKFLEACNDTITVDDVIKLAGNPKKPQGAEGSKLWDRAKRFVELNGQLQWKGEDVLSLLQEIFDVNKWGFDKLSESETPILDMQLLLNKASDISQELENNNPEAPVEDTLAELARRLRYQIATREPFLPDETADLQITTLWGAKGITAEHVYVIGLCKEAIPGIRRKEYPGTELEFIEEQRRLFYVSITRSKKTLVLSRSNSIAWGQARQLGLAVKTGNGFRAKLEMSTFLRDIIQYLPQFQKGENWQGCL